MKFQLHKILVLALALEMLVSSIGVAQVSHLCKLAIAGMETSSCEDLENDEHGCCNMEDQENASEESSCCRDEVRYYQNKVNGTVQEMLHSLPIDIVVINLLNSIFSNPETTSSQQVFLNTWHPPGESGKQIILSINSLLI